MRSIGDTLTIRLPDGSEQTIEITRRFSCAFCGRTLYLAVPVVARDDVSQTQLLHDLPMCDTYRDTELIDFLEMNRKKQGIPLPEVN